MRSLLVLASSAEALRLARPKQKNGNGTGNATAPAVLTVGTDLAATKAEYQQAVKAGSKQADGYMRVGCVNDGMLDTGDKFGKGTAFDVKTPNSIIRYDLVVAEKDHEAMSPDVCYRFCRTFKNTYFFGIQNGENCYCSSYFDVVAGANEDCKVACPGDASQLCGAQTKASIFEMHGCPAQAAFTSGEIANMTSQINAFHEHAAMIEGAALDNIKSLQAVADVEGKKGNTVAMKHQQAAVATHQAFVKRLQNLPYVPADVESSAQTALDAYKAMGPQTTPTEREDTRDTLESEMTSVSDKARVLAAIEAEIVFYPAVEEPKDLELYETVPEGNKTLASSGDGAVMQPVLEVYSTNDCATACKGAVEGDSKCIGFQVYSGYSEYPGAVTCMLFKSVSSYISYEKEGCSVPAATSGHFYLQKTELSRLRAASESADTKVIPECYA